MTSVREDNQLRQEAERKELQTQDHEQRRQQQSGTIGEAFIESKSCEHEIKHDQHAQPKHGRTDHAEKSQRLLRETNQKEYREDIEHQMCVLARTIYSFEAVTLGLS